MRTRREATGNTIAKAVGALLFEVARDLDAQTRSPALRCWLTLQRTHERTFDGCLAVHLTRPAQDRSPKQERSDEPRDREILNQNSRCRCPQVAATLCCTSPRQTAQEAEHKYDGKPVPCVAIRRQHHCRPGFTCSQQSATPRADPINFQDVSSKGIASLASLAAQLAALAAALQLLSYVGSCATVW